MQIGTQMTLIGRICTDGLSSATVFQSAVRGNLRMSFLQRFRSSGAKRSPQQKAAAGVFQTAERGSSGGIILWILISYGEKTTNNEQQTSNNQTLKHSNIIGYSILMHYYPENFLQSGFLCNFT